MKTVDEILPLREIVEPDDPTTVSQVIREARAAEIPIYPIGGGTALHHGLVPHREGIGLSLAKLNRVIDYPARDMTVTVQAGVVVSQLSAQLNAEQQRLTVDVPDTASATLGGIVASNANGPLQFSQGTVRDQVIGIKAVDGTGRLFSGGGRVVKNVAGYDFCKLLTGSLGTLGVITEMTLRLKPIPVASAVVLCHPQDLDEAETLLSGLVHSRTAPAAIELLGGPSWENAGPLETAPPAGIVLAVLFEGTAAEVPWMCDQLCQEWQAEGVRGIETLPPATAATLTANWTEFPAAPAPLTLQFQVVPSSTTKIIAAARAMDGHCSYLAHAGSGVVIVQFPEFPPEGLTNTVVGRLQPVAQEGMGSVVVLSNPSGAELTRQSMWGTSQTPFWLMTNVKREFDPDNILNPDRFVYT